MVILDQGVYNWEGDGEIGISGSIVGNDDLRGTEVILVILPGG